MSSTGDSVTFEAPTVVMVTGPSKRCHHGRDLQCRDELMEVQSPRQHAQGHSCPRTGLRLLGCAAPFFVRALTLDGTQGLRFGKGILDSYIRTAPKATKMSLPAKYWNLLSFIARAASVCSDTLATVNSGPRGDSVPNPSDT